MLLKETATHVAVETECEEVVDVLGALRNVVCQHKQHYVRPPRSVLSSQCVVKFFCNISLLRKEFVMAIIRYIC